MDCLFQFFAGTFHQDWSDDHGDWREAISAFRQRSKDRSTADVAREIRHMLASTVVEEDLERRLLGEFGCYHTPRPDLGGASFREWLIMVCGELESPLPESPRAKPPTRQRRV
jgi:hypothetical protein